MMIGKKEKESSGSKKISEFTVTQLALNDLKQLILNSNKSIETPIYLVDEFFQILSRLTDFTSQVSYLMKKRQQYDKVTAKAKTNLRDQIFAFFENMQSQSKTSSSTILNISTESSFTLVNLGTQKFLKKSDSNNSLDLYDELSNEDIIEKIKNKLDKKKVINEQETFQKTKSPAKPEQNLNKTTSKINSFNIPKDTPKKTPKPVKKVTSQPKTVAKSTTTQIKKYSEKPTSQQKNQNKKSKPKKTDKIEKIDNIDVKERLNSSYSATTKYNHPNILNASFMTITDDGRTAYVNPHLKVNQKVPKPSNLANYYMSKYINVIDSYNSQVSHNRRASATTTNPSTSRKSKQF